MDNITKEIFDYFNDILKSYDLCTEWFIAHYGNEEDSYIKEHDNGVTFEFDITMDDTDNIHRYILKIAELHQKGITYHYEDHENKYDDEEGKRKYMFDITISKYFIRNFKLKKLLL